MGGMLARNFHAARKIPPAGARLSGIHLKKIERSPAIPLQNIHPLGLGEFAGAAGGVALGVIAPGARTIVAANLDFIRARAF